MAKKSASAKTAKPAAKAVKVAKPAKPAAKPTVKAAKKAPAKRAEPKKADLKVLKKPEPKKPEPKKPEPKKAPVKAVEVARAAPVKAAAAKPAPAKPAPVKAPEAPAAAAPGPAGTGRKGITIVTPKPVKKSKPKAPATDISALAGSLLSAGLPRKPLIASGPNAPALKPLGVQGGDDAAPKVSGKSPFGKKELEHFRSVLLRKRAELLGDVSHLEEEALRGESGSLSNMPQHMAEQGSEVYEQSLHLDLAAAGQKLIKEIDDALKRIEEGTYGICELTGKPIKVERLEELPWARYSIEAARELERRSMRT